MSHPSSPLSYLADPFGAVVVLDRQGAVVEGNALALDLMAPDGSPLGQRLSHFLQTEPPEAMTVFLEAALAGGPPQSSEFDLADGRVLEVQAVAVNGGGVARLRDVTERCLVQRRSRVLLDLTTQLAGTLSTTEVVQAVLDRGASVLRSGTASIFRLNSDAQSLRLIAAVGYEADLQKDWTTVPLSLSTPITDAVTQRQAVCLTAQDADERYPHLASARLPGTRGLVALPLIFGDRLLGALSFSLPVAPAFQEAERAFLHALAQLCAQAFERAQLFEAQQGELAERQRAEQALQGERARLEAVLDQLPVAVWIAELPSGRLIAGNQAISQILRHPFLPSEDIGAYKEYQGVHPDGRPYTGEEWPLARTVTHGESIMGEEIEMVRGDDTHGVVSFNSALITDAEGVPLYAVVTGSDITERRRAEAQLLAWNEDLERQVAVRTSALESVNHELEAFSYSVSHDLRRPVRHISGFVNLLRRRLQGRVNPDELRLLDTVDAAAQGMNTMIDALLSFARLSGQELHLSEVSLGDLVREARHQLAPDLVDRQIDWVLGPLPVVWADRTLLCFVLVNLLSNAVKYTGTRPVARIEITAQLSDREVVVNIQDNGVGFEPAAQSKLFGVFQRLHSDRDFEGVGIGLANVKRIVLKHGGRVWADTVPGAGATFSFSLPQSE
ncbi:ATP-binding protein [Deinococcus sp. UYEF24]